MKQTLNRKFLGKVGNKVSDFESKEEMAREKKHLKAYLRGDDRYVIGYENGQPVFEEVKQEFTEIN